MEDKSADLRSELLSRIEDTGRELTRRNHYDAITMHIDTNSKVNLLLKNQVTIMKALEYLLSEEDAV